MEDRFRQPVFHVLMAGDFHVVQHGELGEEPDVLEGARDAALGDLVRLQPDEAVSLEGDMAAGRLVDAREQVERGSLACAVGTDEADQFACVDIHIEVGNGLQAAEHFHDVRGFEKRLIHCLCLPSRNA